MTSRSWRVALATCAAYPDLTPDDQLLRDALAELGCQVTPLVWNDPASSPERHDALVIRSCWDYHLHPDAFAAWLDSLAQRPCRVFNPLAVLRWNFRKTYLRDLAASGVAVVPTAWIARHDGSRLADIMASHGWTDVIVKPVVSATSFETWRVPSLAAATADVRFDRVVRERALMIQPCLPGVRDEGEYSLIFLAGRFSHAVLKRPSPGDFRVQAEFGGTEAPVLPGDDVIRDAARALGAAPAPCLYARVDGCLVDGRFILLELEVLEPTLYLGTRPGAATDLAAALTEALRSKG